eukprot:gene10806-20172_t
MMCPESYHLEHHAGEPNHGDVCRSNGAGNAVVYPHLPGARIETNVDKAARTMHTFYHPFEKSTDNTKDLRIMSSWASSWAGVGYSARMLTLVDARRHPLFEKVSQRIDKLDEANAFGGELLIKGQYCCCEYLNDLDVVEAVVFNVDTVVPRSKRDQIVQKCGRHCENAKSDMIALLLVGLLQDLQGPATFIYVDMSQPRVTSLSRQYVDAINATSEDAAITFCSKAGKFKAMHISHSS